MKELLASCLCVASLALMLTACQDSEHEGPVPDPVPVEHSPKPLPFGPMWNELTEELKEEWEEMKK